MKFKDLANTINRRTAVTVEVLVALLFVAAATAVQLLYLLQSPTHSIEHGFVGTMAVLVGAYCSWLFLFEYRRGRLFSPMNLYAALVGLHFALPGLLLSVDILKFRYDPNFQYLTDCLYFILLCLAAFQVGSLLARARTKETKQLSSRRIPVWGKRRVIIVSSALLLVGWVARIYLISEGIYFQLDRADVSISTWGALFHSLDLFPLYAYSLYLVSYFHRSRLVAVSSRWPVVVASIGIAEFVYWIGAGRKLESILVLILAMIIRYLSIGKLPRRRTVIVGAVGILLLFPATFYYRYSLEVNFGLGTGISNISQVVVEARTITDDAGPATGIILQRINLTESVSAAMRLVESREWELRKGSNYLDVLLIQIPRFVWAGKPDFHYGTEFGHASGLSALGDDLTSVSVTYFGEAYLNFLWGGSIVFLAYGFFAEKIFRRVQSGLNPKWLLLYSLFLPPFLYVGGTAALYFGALLRVLIFFYILCSVLVVRTVTTVSEVNRVEHLNTAKESG